MLAPFQAPNLTELGFVAEARGALEKKMSSTRPEFMCVLHAVCASDCEFLILSIVL